MADINVLKAARDLIANKENWGQFSFRNLVSEKWVFTFKFPFIKEVIEYQYCALGALMFVTGYFESLEEKPWYWSSEKTLLEDKATELYNNCIANVNDKIGHRAVLRCYDEAIKESEKEV